MDGAIRDAFDMRLKHMNPLDHAKKAMEMIDNSAVKQDIVVKWKRIIKGLVEDEQRLIEESENPHNLYPLMAGFSTGFFSYFFNIDRAKDYFREEEYTTIKLPIKQLLKYVDQTQFDPATRSEIYNKDMPIIIIESPLFNQPFCISGTLKIMDAKRVKQSNLKVFYLLQDDYLPLIYDKLSRAMHMFHLDLAKMTSNPVTPSFDKFYISKVQEWI
jgi:hypothetical protein